MKIIIAEETGLPYNICVRNTLLNNNACAHERAGTALLTLPDTALLRRGMPLFVPDTAWPVSARIFAVARICRLGRHIDRNFAHRYYDCVSVAVNFCAEELISSLRERGLPQDIARGFEGSVGIGDLLPAGDCPIKEMSLVIDGEKKVCIDTERLQERLDGSIAFLSRFFKICHGDLIMVGTDERGIEINVGQTLEGFCNEQKCLEIRIK